MLLVFHIQKEVANKFVHLEFLLFDYVVIVNIYSQCCYTIHDFSSRDTNYILAKNIQSAFTKTIIILYVWE